MSPDIIEPDVSPTSPASPEPQSETQNAENDQPNYTQVPSPPSEPAPPVSISAPSFTAVPPTVTVSPPTIVGDNHRPKKRLMVGLVAILVVLGAVAGYVFGFYLPNTPSNIYGTSLHNSGLVLDRLVDYLKHRQQTNYQSNTFSGSAQVKSPSGSYDVSLNGSVNKDGSASASMNADILGEKLTTNIRSVHVPNHTTPDIYVQAAGFKQLLDSAGLNQFDSLDGKWISIDHTIIDTLASNLQQKEGSTQTNGVPSLPTTPQVDDAITRVQAVNKQYLFTTDPSKAVLTTEKFIGQETNNGSVLDHYQVGYDKSHLEAYVSAVGSALDASQLNTWFKHIGNVQNLSQLQSFGSLEQSIKSAAVGYRFDIWADTKSRLISKVSFVDPSDHNVVFNIAQNYSGGSSYPLSLGVSGKDANGNPSSATLGLSLDTATNQMNATLTYSSKTDNGTTTATGNVMFTPSNSPVNVAAPTGAEPIVNVLASLGLGNVLSVNSPAPASTPATNFLTPLRSQ